MEQKHWSIRYVNDDTRQYIRMYALEHNIGIAEVLDLLVEAHKMVSENV